MSASPRETDIQAKPAPSQLGLCDPVRSMPMAAPMQVAVAVTSMPVAVANHAAVAIVVPVMVPASMREMKLAAERLDRRRRLSRKRRSRCRSDERSRDQGNRADCQLGDHCPYLSVAHAQSSGVIGPIEPQRV